MAETRNLVEPVPVLQRTAVDEERDSIAAGFFTAAGCLEPALLVLVLVAIALAGAS